MGGAVGLAVLATISTEHTSGRLAGGESMASALNSGYHLAYLIGAVLVAAAFLTAVAMLRSDTPEEAHETDSLPTGASPPTRPPRNLVSPRSAG